MARGPEGERPADAFAAIEATLPAGSRAETHPDGKGKGEQLGARPCLNVQGA
jgi:hypothetical protein